MADLQFDLTGMQFGKLKAIRYVSTKGWWCECECGVADYFHSHRLRHGAARSCGCTMYDRGPRIEGRTHSTDGYAWVYAPEHPKAVHGRIREHVAVMEKRLGRLLTDEEEVHHRNRVKDDNRDSNLELWSSSHPRTARVEDLVAWAREILALYDDQEAKGDNEVPALSQSEHPLQTQ